jgi:hypothetical protein
MVGRNKQINTGVLHDDAISVILHVVEEKRILTSCSGVFRAHSDGGSGKVGVDDKHGAGCAGNVHTHGCVLDVEALEGPHLTQILEKERKMKRDVQYVGDK